MLVALFVWWTAEAALSLVDIPWHTVWEYNVLEFNSHRRLSSFHPPAPRTLALPRCAWSGRLRISVNFNDDGELIVSPTAEDITESFRGKCWKFSYPSVLLKTSIIDHIR